MRWDRGADRLMFAVDGGQFIQPKRANIPLLIKGRHNIGGVDAGVDGAIGKHCHQFFQHIFRPADLIEPIVDEGDVHLAMNNPVCLWMKNAPSLAMISRTASVNFSTCSDVIIGNANDKK